MEDEGLEERIKAQVEPRVERVERIYERHGRVFKVVWVLLGALVVVAGLAMTVLPGPAIVVVPVGFAMLGAAFGWARRFVRLSIDAGAEGAGLVARASTPTKVLGGLAIACAVGAVVALLLLR